MSTAICHRCGAGKDLPLGRCGACGVVPEGPDRELAMLCSRHFLKEEGELARLAERIRKGEPLQPDAAARAAARALLQPGEPEWVLQPRELVLLSLGNLLLTPLLGYAIWFRARGRPAGRQALAVTVPCSLLLAVGILAWRLLG